MIFGFEFFISFELYNSFFLVEVYRKGKGNRFFFGFR